MFNNINITFIIRALVALALSFCLFSVSCLDPEHVLLGDWSLTGRQKLNNINYSGTVKRSFEDDLTYKEVTKLTSIDLSSDLEIIFRGTYDVEQEGELNITLDDSSINGVEVEISTNFTLEYELDGNQLTFIDENGSETTYTKL